MTVSSTPKVVPGYRYFHCRLCGSRWSEASRDCRSLSGESCLYFRADQLCDNDHIIPYEFTEQPDWPVSPSGDLLESYPMGGDGHRFN
jgi:hypothetical protein